MIYRVSKYRTLKEDGKKKTVGQVVYCGIDKTEACIAYHTETVYLNNGEGDVELHVDLIKCSASGFSFDEVVRQVPAE